MDAELSMRFENVDAENKRQNRRIDDLEGEIKNMQDISLSVQKLAINMESMLAELKRHGAKLEALEAEPAEKWRRTITTICSTIVSVLAGGLAVGIIVMIANNLK